MKALLIDPETRSIERIEVGGRDDIAKLIGFDTVISDEIGSEGDRLFFDEECFLRGTQGRFQIDTLIPVAGKGIILGSTDGGQTLTDARTDIENIRARIKYL